MTVLDLDRPIGLTQLKRVEQSEVVGDGLAPDLGMKLLRLGDEHSTRLLQRRRTPLKRRLRVAWWKMEWNKMLVCTQEPRSSSSESCVATRCASSSSAGVI